MTESKAPSLTAIIIAKNEAAMLESCLGCLWWCQQVLVLDVGSTDQTARLAEKTGAKVVGFAHDSMARKRNEALKHIETDWAFYVDADERVTPTLAKEIMVQLETNQPAALKMNRQNIHYGQIMHHGGWQDDWVTRVFKVDQFESWTGQVHESPHFSGQALELQSPLIHLTHRDTLSGFNKTMAWTPIEAELLYKADAPQVKFLTIMRKGVMEFLRRGIFQGGYKDGSVGWLEALVQGMNRCLVYLQLWEKQQKPSLEKKYEQIEEQIAYMRSETQ